jgi:hypothetical protein
MEQDSIEKVINGLGNQIDKIKKMKVGKTNK